MTVEFIWRMTNRTRERLATGIYRDRFGIAIKISVDGEPREYRKDEHGVPYKGRPTSWLIREKIRLEGAAELQRVRRLAKACTFAADVDRYLETIRSDAHRRNERGYLKHWAVFNDRDRNEITELEIQQHFATITKKPSTLNHIRHALIALYQTLNGRTGHNPARVLKKVREQYDDARALPYATIEQIFAALDTTPTKARLMVMAYTGLPPALIERITPHDLHLDRRAVYVRPRRKGKGAPGRLLPLSSAGVEAFRLFAAQNAYGTFQRKQLQRTFEHGIVQSGASVPPGTRPYDLRHSFLTEAYRHSGDLRGVSELAMHATLQQTTRYERAAVSERATKIVASMPARATKRKRGRHGQGSKSVQNAPRAARAGTEAAHQRTSSKTRDFQRKQRLTRS